MSGRWKKLVRTETLKIQAPILTSPPGFAPFDFHQFGDDIRIVFIKGIIDRLVKDFGPVLSGVVVYHVPGVSGTVSMSSWISSNT